MINGCLEELNGTRINVFRVVQNRTKEELWSIIKEWVVQGSVIISDCWKDYNFLSHEGYQHFRVNHSLTFKVPETGAHTNSIEEMWSAIKRSLRNHAAHVEDEFDHHLEEYMWRRWRVHSMDDDVFREFLRALTTLYPPMEKDVPSCQVIYSQFGLAIHQNDHQARRRFFEWAQNEIAVVPDFQKRILFSDEAHFWLNGYVNKQNCRILSEANPQVYVETPLHPEKLTVWYALWAGGIKGPYFFKNDEGHNVTVNGDRYRAMITNFFIPELNNHDVQELWFQQDGATCHTARATIDLLKDTFWICELASKIL
ncbi:uncharacterized protein TNCV_2322161 [Trichonephila clavipes]|nr:uncharacterized protein TNCV_2322161 [Trichonephila clavipes]